MTGYKRTLLLLIGMFAVVGMITVATLRGRGQNTSTLAIQERTDKSRYPIADYTAPEPSDPQERAQRQARGSRYNGRGTPETGGGVQEGTEPLESLIFRTGTAGSLQALPVSQSDIILAGDVLNAHAYMSPDKSGVYSEFTLSISEVFKGNEKTPFSLNQSLIVTREGGQVRFPAGVTNLYATYGEGMPRIGGKYLFFLKHYERGNDYALLTAYELKEGRVYPLDGFNAHEKVVESPFDVYEGADEKSFLNQVRNLIKSSPKTEGKERGD